jgi:hypothetical protein
MFDITSLIWVAGLFLGLVISDAAYFGDPLQVQISVPAKLANTGFTEVTAEQLFAAEVFNIGQAVSLVPTPRVQISSRPTIASAVAKPLNLDKVVTAVQIQLGADLTTISGSVMVDDKGPQLAMVMVVVVPQEAPVQVKLTQDDGDASALIRHAANLALERVAPYRVALTQFARGLEGDKVALADAKGTASRAVKQHWVAVANRASERVMLFNLLGLLAVADTDAAGAEAQFRLSDYIPDAALAAHGTVSLNRAFLAIAAKQPEQATKWLSTGLKQTAEVRLPGWQEWTLVLSGLTAWSRGELEHAEKLLREATADAVDDDVPYFYLAQLLAAKGDAAGAAEARISAASRHQFSVRIPSLALADFWVDPVNGGLQRRQ